MYVYLCAATPDPTHKSTCLKMYRESSVSSESIECAYLTSQNKTDTPPVEIILFLLS